MAPSQAEAIDMVDKWADILVSKGDLILEVKVSTREGAIELLRWMYSQDDSPMKATLKELSWDKAVVPKKVADALDGLREAMQQ